MSRGRLTPARAVTEWTPETVMRAAIGGDETPAELLSTRSTTERDIFATRRVDRK
jgi:hypothetical protein